MALREVRLADQWQQWDPAYLIDIAVRRWTSFDRRHRPGKRTPERQIQDLLHGLREGSGEDRLYEERGWMEHVAERFGAVMLAVDEAGSVQSDDPET